MLSLCMSLPFPHGDPIIVMFLDTSEAHPHCKVRRDDLFVNLPAEAGIADDECGLLKMCLYGLRDANQSLRLLQPGQGPAALRFWFALKLAVIGLP